LTRALATDISEHICRTFGCSYHLICTALSSWPGWQCLWKFCCTALPSNGV